MAKYDPIVLIILDGWGISPSWGGNALAVNNPENINRYWREYPHKVLQAFTLVAGKYGVVGDSRLGHSTIAAGRRIPQELEVISEAIINRSFYKNKVLIAAIRHCQKNNSNLHLLGLLSNGGVHAHLSHLKALLEMCYRFDFERVYLDLITDGIDSGHNDAISFIDQIKIKMTETDVGKFSSVMGRYYGMDRAGDFKRTKTAYDLLTAGKGQAHDSILEAVSSAYRTGYTDFNLPPMVIKNQGQAQEIDDNDSVIFFNLRSDRSKQLAEFLTGKTSRFLGPKKIKNLHLVTLTEYDKSLEAEVAFPKNEVANTLGEVLSKHQKRQLRLAESEKATHVTSFFDCGHFEPFSGEEIKIIPSKRIDPAKNPQMAAFKIAKTAVHAIRHKKYDFILINFANVDMVSHTGNMIAAGKAIQVVDKVVSQIVKENLAVGGATIITADHGNIEQMVKLKPEQDPEAKHTMNPVPFILITKDNKKNLFQGAISSYGSILPSIVTAKETLTDIAPTVLELMSLPKPAAMTGHSLLTKLE